MIPTFQAVQLHRFMGSGRTTPALCGCEDENGKLVGEFVVKLRGGLDRNVTGLAAELVATQLATYFGIPVPAPALVSIDAEFADLVALSFPEKSKRIRDSIGLNFGSRQLSDVIIWPVDKAIPEAMLRTAVSIFAFDALIENPDRKFSPNPNLFIRGDTIFVFDHEVAFSFIEDIFPSTTPWKLDRGNYLSDHVFFKQLKGKDIDLSTFTNRLELLSDTEISKIMAEVPNEWNNSNLSRIRGHLSAVVGQFALFAEEIRRRLV